MTNSPLPVAILAGGLAQRLRPITETVPKSLLVVAGEPFIAHQLRLLRKEGFRRVILCVGYLGEQIEHFVGTGAAYGLEVVYSWERTGRLLGTGGALRNALPLCGESFCILYGDSYLLAPLAALAEGFRQSDRKGMMTVFRNDGQWDTSNVIFRDGRILDYSKSAHSPAMQHIDYGFGALRSETLANYELGTPFDLSGVFRNLLIDKRLLGVEVFERFYEIGSSNGLIETDRFLSNINARAARSKL